ncbi:unnamed protein product [Prorocentrum cordatum]|uniref:Uncharacterized protein n=1 Tax=Prorocentrum cordatum TaxID=2364126 RepID=A0ABN9SA71_9DINO|nr:unnamed protein product [Polarella glacialis]
MVPVSGRDVLPCPFCHSLASDSVAHRDACVAVQSLRNNLSPEHARSPTILLLLLFLACSPLLVASALVFLPILLLFSSSARAPFCLRLPQRTSLSGAAGGQRWQGSGDVQPSHLWLNTPEGTHSHSVPSSTELPRIFGRPLWVVVLFSFTRQMNPDQRGNDELYDNDSGPYDVAAGGFEHLTEGQVPQVRPAAPEPSPQGRTREDRIPRRASRRPSARSSGGASPRTASRGVAGRRGPRAAATPGWLAATMAEAEATARARRARPPRTRG